MIKLPVILLLELCSNFVNEHRGAYGSKNECIYAAKEVHADHSLLRFKCFEENYARERDGDLAPSEFATPREERHKTFLDRMKKCPK